MNRTARVIVAVWKTSGPLTTQALEERPLRKGEKKRSERGNWEDLIQFDSLESVHLSITNSHLRSSLLLPTVISAPTERNPHLIPLERLVPAELQGAFVSILPI